MPEISQERLNYFYELERNYKSLEENYLAWREQYNDFESAKIKQMSEAKSQAIQDVIDVRKALEDLLGKISELRQIIRVKDDALVAGHKKESVSHNIEDCDYCQAIAKHEEAS